MTIQLFFYCFEQYHDNVVFLGSGLVVVGLGPSLSAAVLAEADLVRLGVQVPQVLVPEHPAIIDGVAVGAVVVAVRWVPILVHALVVHALNSQGVRLHPILPLILSLIYTHTKGGLPSNHFMMAKIRSVRS